MDVAVLSTLIGTSIPHGVTFNSCGVAQRGLRYEFKFQKLRVTFEVCSLNGIWGGSLHISTNLWGYACPITRRDFTFSSFEECVTYLWGLAHDRIESNKSNISMEFLHFKVERNKWLTRSAEEKFNWFKEVNFYEW